MSAKLSVKILAQLLVDWYSHNRRDLPWRSSRDPYRIWISEVMLQQTTTTAVLPFYDKFLVRFPNLQSLAKAPLEAVYEQWAGLGYYSRARNLHKSAQQLSKTGFPKTAEELLQFPGFGPYTSRAVASLAFGESVGVLDGNVIRVLSRVYGQAFQHWQSQDKAELQNLSDQFAKLFDSSTTNQGLMELGATVCTPKNPQCLLCPWMKVCQARAQDKIFSLPLQKPKRKSELWLWKPTVFRRGSKVALIKNDYAPFLKNQWIFPGTVEMKTKRPKEFDLKHGITHHDIYIRVIHSQPGIPGDNARTVKKAVKWISSSELSKINPSSLLKKVLQFKS